MSVYTHDVEANWCEVSAQAVRRGDVIPMSPWPEVVRKVEPFVRYGKPWVRITVSRMDKPSVRYRREYRSKQVVRVLMGAA
jgi:hypothetical protein